MQHLLNITTLLFAHLIYAQTATITNLQTNDTITYETYYYIDGDTIPRPYLDLNEIYLLNPLKFNTPQQRRDYQLLRRRTHKVYPYAMLAAQRLQTMQERLDQLNNNRQRRIYTQRIQRYIEDEFTEELKKLSRSEGRILIKLIHRQTGITVYDLIRELRSGFRAFRYNTTASLFDISLRTEFQPHLNQEDFLIEDILQRAFQDGTLQMQSAANPQNYFDLKDIWYSNP